MLGYTGTYKNKKVTVMAHGMGMPSIGIYSYELFHFYDVNTIIRIGSSGSFVKEADVGSVMVAEKAFSHSIYAKDLGVKDHNHFLSATSITLNKCLQTAKQLNMKIFKGNILSEDVFYSAIPWQKRAKLGGGTIGCEMEAYALYANAIKTKKNALCLLTVANSFVTGSDMSAQDRQTSFKNMVKLALETAIKL
jgi:purine-nucleoside phosphorylase